MLGKKEGQESGRSVKSVIAKLNANVLPQKKRFSPPKNVLKHSLSMKSPQKSPRISQPKNRQKLRSLSNSVKKTGNSSKAPKSTGTTTSKVSKSSNCLKISKAVKNDDQVYRKLDCIHISRI